MALDGLFLHKLLTELAPTLTGAKINRIHQPEPYGVTLKLTSPQQGNCILFFSAHPQNARLHLTDYPRQNPANPPLFCMVLRKHLEGGRILSLHQHGLDRIVEIEVEARNEIGDKEKKILIFEIMGKHSNLILLNGERTILAGIKQYGTNVSRYRQVLPHIPYLAPQSQDKHNPFLLTEEEFSAALLSGATEAPIAAALQKKIEGLSPVTAREIVARSGVEGMVETMGAYDYHRLFTALQDFAGAAPEPAITIAADGKEEFYYLPLTSWGQRIVPFPAIGLLLDTFYQKKEAGNAFQSRKRELLKVLGQKRERLANTVHKQQRELAEAENGERYRVFGELLSAFLFQVPNGAETVSLENFYDGNAPIVIPLDPALSPQNNAQRYFRLYNKKKAAKDAIARHLQDNQKELAYLDSLIAHGELAQNGEELAALREECREAGYIKEKKRKIKDKPGVMPPHQFFYEGYEILVGRNNKGNDRLTLKTATKDDLWFHVKDIPGSHVILRRKDKENIPGHVVQKAAAIAAWFSKARQSGNVPVDCTAVKDVKKPAGAKPGIVIFFNQTTLYVDPATPEEETP